MHFLIVLALSLIDNVRACSSNKCECQKGYKAEDYGYRTLCYKRYTGKKTYDDAQITCKNDKAKFPYVNSEEDLTFYTSITKSAQWIQAKKQGVVINFKQWRDWKGLPLFGLDWYKENSPEDEEVNIENYAYISNGKLSATDPTGKQPFTCQYVINCKTQL